MVCSYIISCYLHVYLSEVSQYHLLKEALVTELGAMLSIMWHSP